MHSPILIVCVCLREIVILKWAWLERLCRSLRFRCLALLCSTARYFQIGHRASEIRINCSAAVDPSTPCLRAPIICVRTSVVSSPLRRCVQSDDDVFLFVSTAFALARIL